MLGVTAAVLSYTSMSFYQLSDCAWQARVLDASHYLERKEVRELLDTLRVSNGGTWGA